MPLRTIIAASVILSAIAAPAMSVEPTVDAIPSKDGEILIHPINHATFVMTWDGKTVYVDPVGGADLFDGFAAPDLILITHIHGDHLSADTVKAVAAETTLVVAPATVVEALGDGVPGETVVLTVGESLERRGIGIEAVPAYNLTEDRLNFHPKQRGDNGYVVTVGGKRIYISGDTEDIPEMRALADIDAAFVCMNLPYTMTVEAAADAVLEFAPKIVYPYHYRGKGGFSDLDRFDKLVAANPAIEVRRLAWY